jgi:hypothetical protein
MERCQGHQANLGWIGRLRNASGLISMVVLGAKIGNKRPIDELSNRRPVEETLSQPAEIRS